MQHAEVPTDEIERRGIEWYVREIRAKVEVEENIGKLIVIDSRSGDYEIAEEGLIAGRRLQMRRPDAAMLCLRIGYNAVYSLGGVLTRTKQ